MNGHATAVGTRTPDASGLLEPLRNHHRYEMLSDLNRFAAAALAQLRVASSLFASFPVRGKKRGRLSLSV